MSADELDALRDELLVLVTTRAVRFGDFVLTSGKHSDFFVEGKRVTLDGRGAYLVGRLGLQRCRDLGVEAVGGLTLGADPMAAAIAALSGESDSPIPAFIVRKQQHEHGMGRLIEGPELAAGARVLLVDDTLTSGGTFLTAREHVLKAGAIPLEAFCVVDREEGGREALQAVGLSVFALFTRSELAARNATLSPSPG